MLSMRQLSIAIDSIKKMKGNFVARIRSEVFSPIAGLKVLDSNWKASGVKVTGSSFDAFIPDSVKGFLQARLNTKISSIKANNDALSLQYNDYLKTLYNHEIEWHRKITLSVACLVLFLIGAPLGSIIRKGGLGTPLIFAIVFFMVFYFTSTTGEKFGREGNWSTTAGMWFSTFVLVPIGIFLTYKALNDSQLFNKESYARFLNRLPFRRRKY